MTTEEILFYRKNIGALRLFSLPWRVYYLSILVSAEISVLKELQYIAQKHVPLQKSPGDVQLSFYFPNRALLALLTEVEGAVFERGSRVASRYYI